MDPFIINAVNHWDGWVLVPIGIFYFQKSLKPPTFLRKQYSIPSLFFVFLGFFWGGGLFIFF